tara:strand:- start:1648 stop:2028 length:381 start_codon:yes stop_codon:yes gene_type:complete
METNQNNFNIDYINRLIDNYYDDDLDTRGWKNKDTLRCITVLSDIFNGYLDAAQHTVNFSQTLSTDSSHKEELTITLAKNLLFITQLIQKESITPEALFISLKKAFPYQATSHPSYRDFHLIHSEE